LTISNAPNATLNGYAQNAKKAAIKITQFHFISKTMKLLGLVAIVLLKGIVKSRIKILNESNIYLFHKLILKLNNLNSFFNYFHFFRFCIYFSFILIKLKSYLHIFLCEFKKIFRIFFIFINLFKIIFKYKKNNFYS
jgi:hypothetical protein